jgi:hypothetical protein
MQMLTNSSEGNAQMDELVIKNTDKEIVRKILQLLAEQCPIPSAAEFGIEFDERWYVRSNPDIAKAVAQETCPSPLLD